MWVIGVMDTVIVPKVRYVVVVLSGQPKYRVLLCELVTSSVLIAEGQG